MKKKINVSENMQEVRAILEVIPEDKQPIAQGLYDELVFMQNTLATLKKEVEEDGPTAMFRQGKQEFLREHPALKAYNTTIQRFSLIYKQLAELLPKDTGKPVNDPLIDFIEE